ncbi:MAG: hypothetical protein MH252_00790 [Thermosynechococcaceae cyanobacterium MS004]|nr:hypothetical protein [Thermosynechococcaceae cyanobacterium MS004]
MSKDIQFLGDRPSGSWSPLRFVNLPPVAARCCTVLHGISIATTISLIVGSALVHR